MPFDDYTRKDRRWIINRVQTDPASRCGVDQQVTIGGSPEMVKIACTDNENPYEGGWYDEDSNSIKGVNGEYEIRLRIEFIPKVSDSSGGSWTAEDQGPWSGDG